MVILRIHHRKPYIPILAILAVIVLLSVLGYHHYAIRRPNPNSHCYVCEGLRYHAPCLLDLSTGNILELSVYENDPITQGELAQNQTTGNFSFMRSGNMTAARNTGVSCSATIPPISQKMDCSLFCEACRSAMECVPNSGIVLADLYDLGNIQYFTLEDGANYSFRDYQIHIEKKTDSTQLEITVLGTR